MGKIEILQGIIEENIDWFWGNDPIVSYETNIEKLWNAFKAWCLPNCLEVVDGLEESIVDKVIDSNYSIWCEKQIF